MSQALPAPHTVPDPRKGRRTLMLLAFVAIAPFAASYFFYYVAPRASFVNYGTLVAIPAPDVRGLRPDGTPFTLATLSGKWSLLVAAPGNCDRPCRQTLYAMRQARTMQGREADRIARVWLVTDGGHPPAEVLAEHPGLSIVDADPAALAAWPAGNDALYLVDPLGNIVLHFPRDPDIKALAKDLGRLLRASSIG